ncbi:MAG: cysteine--tRNA ligase, partial [Planctomycetes bacterium]|nr:cysteine--tRNA ligase [Planctomycetota bacterium]
HIMQWPSPWGAGYPGWHLECSVMSMKYLGQTIDIHGGGLENQFPHHECEIAQSEAANGIQFVKYWLHHNMVTVDGQKMGKSLNNSITLKQAFSGAHERLTRSYDPLAIRQLILNSHYRSPLDFSDAALFAAQSGFEKISEAVKAVRKRLGQASEGEADEEVADQLTELTEKFQAAMNDDLNTSIALSVVFELVRLANKLLEEGNPTADTLSAVNELFGELGADVLGVVKDEYGQAGPAHEERIDEVVKIVIAQRSQARKNKNFARADELRAKLDDAGVVLEDKPDGTQWRWK